MIRVKWLILAIAMPVLLIACKPPESKEISCDLPLPGSPPPQSKSLAVAMYVDGTPSMQGYVTHPTNTKTRYIETIDLLDQTLSVGGIPALRDQPQIEYNRLGETSEKIDREGYLQARYPNFYSGSDPKFRLQGVSKIETAITSAEDGKLTVIVTDLYQQGEDVTKLTQKIQQNYFNPNQLGYAAGILAIRSEFNGKVYIEDGTKKDFPYNTNDAQGNLIRTQEFKPFYAIFLGHYSDISYYFKKLSDTKKLPEDSHLVIFSPNNLVSSLSYLQNSPETPEGLSRRESLNDGNVALDKKDNKTELFEIENHENKEFPLKYSIPLLPLSNTLLVDPNSIQTEIKIEASDTLEKQLKAQPQDSPLAQTLELSQWEIDGNKNLKFLTTIKPSVIPEAGIYLFTVDAVAKGVQKEDWWTEWNATSNTSSNGKTYNLQPFLEGLKASTDNVMKNNKVVIGRFCFAIQKN
ncbi:hypothetical protein [Nostoc sp.]|uniref:hypothetical protein n=1 Tax=Nostoc sp. TaxID=1180 RepID=UPI0035934FB6